MGVTVVNPHANQMASNRNLQNLLMQMGGMMLRQNQQELAGRELSQALQFGRQHGNEYNDPNFMGPPRPIPQFQTAPAQNALAQVLLPRTSEFGAKPWWMEGAGPDAAGKYRKHLIEGGGSQPKYQALPYYDKNGKKRMKRVPLENIEGEVNAIIDAGGSLETDSLRMDPIEEFKFGQSMMNMAEGDAFDPQGEWGGAQTPQDPKRYALGQQIMDSALKKMKRKGMNIGAMVDRGEIAGPVDIRTLGSGDAFASRRNAAGEMVPGGLESIWGELSDEEKETAYLALQKGRRPSEIVKHFNTTRGG